jgi:hypothetical protein
MEIDVTISSEAVEQADRTPDPRLERLLAAGRAVEANLSEGDFISQSRLAEWIEALDAYNGGEV